MTVGAYIGHPRGGVKMNRHASLVALLVGVLLSPAIALPAEVSSPQALVEQLHRITLDPEAIYQVEELYLRRQAVRLELTRGTLAFFQPVEDSVTGALFVGTGEILMMPGDTNERRQLAKFTRSPILAEHFTSAYFRFTDATAAELRAQIAAGRGTPAHDPELMQDWSAVIYSLNPQHSLRVLADLLSRNPRPYFYAAIDSPHLGTFDVLVDTRLNEPIVLGQTRWQNQLRYYDLWCSFALRAEPLPELPADKSSGGAQSYHIQTTIHPDQSLEGIAEVRFRAPYPGDRLAVFELSRYLKVQEVTDTQGQPLPFFQNETLGPEELRYRGSDSVIVVLPEPFLPEASYALRLRYRGQVISDLGNGVLYVGARGIWYPSLLPMRPAQFELEFRYPRPLELVASGVRTAASEEGEWRSSRWISEVPIPRAGFNLGTYESQERMVGRVRISVHANRQLEPILARPLTEPAISPLELDRLHRRPRSGPLIPPLEVFLLPPPSPPRPATLIPDVGTEVAQAVEFFAEHFGPFPYRQLSVSQIPGSFGQGFPGLLYLSTLTFLPAADQARLGLGERARDLLSELVPVHETAHQWWGNLVGVNSYRDEWLLEALATYSSLLYLEGKPEGASAVREWLGRYRSDLLAKTEDGEYAEAAGPVSLGQRLNSSQSPRAFQRVVYSKGPWILHMLRHLLSDEAFFDLLRAIVAGYTQRPFSTQALQALAQARMPASADVEGTHSLDWFFLQWVYDTGIPHYRLQFRIERLGPQRSRIRGTITQRGVPDTFIMPVPLYAQARGQLHFLGRVVVSGPETSFEYVVSSRPERILLDPHQTVLCVVE